MKNTNLIIGKTNFGKTRGILFKEVKNSIKNNENLLILDNKMEYYKTYSKNLKENGYDVLVLNLDDTIKSNGFNPLYLPYMYYKNGDMDSSINLVNNLAHSLFYSNSSTDPFWENMAADYFTGLSQILFKEGKEEEINLGSISLMENKISMLTNENGKLLIKDYLNKLNPLDSIYVLSAPTLFSPNETRESIAAVMKQKLNLFLMRPNLFNLLSISEIKLDELKDKTAIFVIGNDNYNNLIKVFLGQLFEVITKNKKVFTLILDNYTYPYINRLKYLVDNATYYNLKIFVAIKNKEEFESCYESYIIDSFENVITIDNELKELEDIGDNSEYPMLEQKEQKYFDIGKILSK